MLSERTPVDTALMMGRYSKEKEFWLKKLSGGLSRSVFPYDFNRNKSSSPDLEVLNFTIPESLSSKLVELATGLDHRLHMILTSGLILLLSRYSSHQDIVLGTPIYTQDVDGDFVNTVLVIRQSLADEMTFRELLLNVRTSILESLDNQNFPIETLLYLLGFPHSNENDEFPLFDVAVLLENIQKRQYIRHIRTNFLLNFCRTDQAITGTLEYNPTLYRKETATRIISHYFLLLEKAVYSLELTIDALDLVSPAEKNQILNEFNNTVRSYPRDRTIDSLLEEQVEKNGDKLAGLGEENSITYRELNRKADKLAAYLDSRGIKQDEALGVMLDDCLETVVVVFGILKCGAAYLPINRDYPPERKKYILDDAGVGILFTNNGGAEELAVELVDIASVINGVNIHYQRGRLIETGLHNGDNLAYIMYTSGSTGIPKGVLINHRSVVRLVRNNDFIRFYDGDRLLKTGVLEFDASTFEIWGPLLNGAGLCMLSYNIILDHTALKVSIRKFRITVMWLTASLFNQMAGRDPEIFAGLRTVIAGGDILSPPHINRVGRHLPGIEIINGYGPTENTTFSTTHAIDHEYDERIPIGRPLSNSLLFIMDRHGHLLPPGIVGEICVGGDGLARGYLNNPDLSAEKFVDYRTPFPESLILYRTGDLGRWSPDGNVEFFGRADRQVKIRGYRIEPGEIENHLLECTGVKDIVVIAGRDEESNKYLCAYVVPENKDTPLNSRELRHFLNVRLPDYMIPAYFVQMEALPLNENGKINRKALPNPKQMIDREDHYAPPRNETETAMIDIWAEVLGLEPQKIGIHHSFFELGGNSISILKVHDRLNKDISHISLSDLFIYPTIGELSVRLKAEQSAKKSERVIRLNDSVKEKKLFILHPLHGMVYPYKELSRLLSDTFTIYGIQAKGLDGSARLPSNFGEMLDDYYREIRAVQSRGPYIVAGYCIGNIFAYEMVRKLEDAGEQVEKLVLMDISSRFVDYYTLYLRPKQWAADLFRDIFGIKRDKKSSRGGPAPKMADLSVELDERKKQVEDNIDRVLKTYEFRRSIHSPVLIIKARERQDSRLTIDRSRKMTAGEVEISETGGDHMTMFEAPHVEKLAEIFRNSL